jgi:hypothetical protein
MRSRILKRIVSLIVMVFLSSLTVHAARNVTITRAFVDLNADGKRDAVAIKMTSGSYYKANDPADEGCPSCACGVAKYSGKFSIEVRINGGKPVRQNLNALMGGFDELEFWAEPWRIVFADYNRDGQVDFNLGQYFSCNGWVYRLFTVARDGRISRLEVDEGNPDSEIFADDDNNSTRVIRSTADGFYTKGYYNAADPPGFYTSYYTWDTKKRSFIFGKDVYDRIQKKWSQTKPHWARGN